MHEPQPRLAVGEYELRLAGVLRGSVRRRDALAPWTSVHILVWEIFREGPAALEPGLGTTATK